MEFKLHIGTEKTGSSFLQTMCALGRAELACSGVHFPKTLRCFEDQMANGQVSPGNAVEIALALGSESKSQLLKILKAIVSQAEARSLNIVLLSSEWLLPNLMHPGRVSLLQDALYETGANSVSFCLVLRDPVDQCISLYKHRAKGGAAGDISNWCASSYHVPIELAGFRKQAEALGLELTVQPYSRESRQLEAQFFVDWLGVQTPLICVPKTVNPSLALSELTLLRLVAQTNPALVEPLYNALADLEPGEKAQGEALEAHSIAVAAHAVSKHAEEWAAWNSYMPSDAQLKVPEPSDPPASPPNAVGFSEVQLAVLADLLARSATPGFIAQMAWRQHLRPVLGRAKRAIWRNMR